MDYVVKA